jgi:hypothetical protein
MTTPSADVHFTMANRRTNHLLGDGSIVQFLYGEDGVETTKATGLNWTALIARNHEIFSQRMVKSNLIDVDTVATHRQKIKDAAAAVKKSEVEVRSKGEPLLSKFSAARYFGSGNPPPLLRDK